MLQVCVRFTYPGDKKVQKRVQEVASWHMVYAAMLDTVQSTLRSLDKPNYLEVIVREVEPLPVRMARKALE